MMNWSFFKSFIQYFIPIVLIVVILSTILFELRNDSELHIIKSREVDTIQLIKNSFENEFDLIISDLMVLAESEQLIHFIYTKDKKHLNLVVNEFLSICKWKKNYDQLRLIDSNGNELIRINMINGECIAVGREQLQNKNERYYFKETINKNANEVYISPFDLNVEQEKIEYPLKPVVRFSTPVFDSKNQKKGIIVINYLGNNILNRIEKIADGNTGEISVINKLGYWLLSPNPEDEWGFMFADGINKKFKYQYPESWEVISNNNIGQFENDNGVFTYQDINLGRESKLDLKISNDKNQWKIISRISPETIRNNAFLIFMDFIIFNIYILLLILIVSYLLARAKVRKKVHKESLKEKERLHGVIEMAGAVSHEINQPLQIITTYIDLITHPDNKNKNIEKSLPKIADQINRIGKISRKLSKITKYKTRDYLKGVKIIDIDKSSDIKD
jgi:hypothetical protein